jgi:hypothetical protein
MFLHGNEYKIQKWLVLKFHGSGHLQIILHLNKITDCLKMITFKIVFTFDVFLVLKPHVLQGDMYFIYEIGTFQSALLFTSTISDPMTVT